MDRWLAAVEADTAAGTIEEKIVRNKPADVTDRCYVEVGEGPPVNDPTACNTAYPYYGAPRIAAGGPTTHDIVRCETAPLPETPPADGSYGSVPFVADEWERLRAEFPEGVCDWSKRHRDESVSRPWLTYAEGPGGEPLGPPPVPSVIG